MKTVILGLMLTLSTFATSALAEGTLKVEYVSALQYNEWQDEHIPAAIRDRLFMDEASVSLLSPYPSDQLTIGEHRNCRITGVHADSLEIKATARAGWRNPSGPWKYFEVQYTGRMSISELVRTSAHVRIEVPQENIPDAKYLSSVLPTASWEGVASNAYVDRIEVYFSSNSPKISVRIYLSWREKVSEESRDVQWGDQVVSYDFASAKEYARAIGTALSEPVPHVKDYGMGPACRFLALGK